jgi:hypothetical protein
MPSRRRLSSFNPHAFHIYHKTDQVEPLPKSAQTGQSSKAAGEAHGATNKERQVCARRRDGELAVSSTEAQTFSPAYPELL